MTEEHDELALRRFDKAEYSVDCSPKDCLKKALSHMSGWCCNRSACD